MSFMLGSFSNGLFGSAASVLSMYQMYQGIQQNARYLKSGDDIAAAAAEDKAKRDAGGVSGETAINETATNPSTAPASPAIGPVANVDKIKVPAGTAATPGTPGLSQSPDSRERDKVEPERTYPLGKPDPSMPDLWRDGAPGRPGGPTADEPPDPAKQRKLDQAAAALRAVGGGALGQSMVRSRQRAAVDAAAMPAPPAEPPQSAITNIPVGGVDPANSRLNAPSQLTNKPVGSTVTYPGQGRQAVAPAAPAAPAEPTAPAAPRPSAITNTPVGGADPARSAITNAPVGGVDPSQSRLNAPSQLTNQPVGSTVTVPGQSPETIQGTPQTEAGAAPPDLGRRIMSAFNPISSARAAEAVPNKPGPDGKSYEPYPTGSVVPPALPGAAAAPAAPTSAPAPAAAPAKGALAASPAASANAQNPAQVAAQQTTQQPAPQAGPTAVTVPASTAQVAPGQQSPTLQSEKTPTLIKPPLRMDYYKSLSEQAPAWRSLVDRIAEEEGIDPARLAAHWYMESRFQTKIRNGKDGERGIMQIMPPTLKGLDPQGKLNPDDAEDSLRLGAHLINLSDREFGRNSVQSVMAYQSGAKNAHAVHDDPGNAMRDHPRMMNYAKQFYNDDVVFGPQHYTKGNPPEARAMVEAARQGPDSFINYLSRTGREGMQMSDKWRAAETSMMVAAASRGDYAGVAHARDLVFQMSQQGMMENVMRADQALAIGDGVSASQFLAKAHAFFPDGTMGQFGVDKSGNVWSQRVDEHDPSIKLGKPNQVTREGLAALLSASRDPRKYQELVQGQQKLASNLRLQAAQTINELDLPGSRQRTAELGYLQHQDTLESNRLIQQQRDDTLRLGINTRADSAAAADATNRQKLQDTHNEFVRGVEKEAGALFGPDNQSLGADGVTPLVKIPGALARASQIYSDLRIGAKVGGVPQPSPHAQHLAEGVVTGRLGLKANPETGRYDVVDPKDENTSLGTIGGALGAHLQKVQFKPDAKPNQSPVGSRPVPRPALDSSAMPAGTRPN